MKSRRCNCCYASRGLYSIESISTVRRICAEVFAAIKTKAYVMIVFTSTGKAARLIAKYRPTMPVISNLGSTFPN
ncbi:hypothetical protein C5167_042252 [Papaver somniferum]|uniref:Pyruvate kinase C-terminal domain-containing protein n=1 Tax=Papaver somniferum TaxID=3469 RepID=A0A4Y7L671_PAPSO|nr:hypothetical protein C5167_042252 [Papaver somniferum]